MAAEVQDKDTEIARLKAIIERFNETIEKRTEAELGMMANLQEHYKSMLTRAADALAERVFVNKNTNQDIPILIAQLRKAAE